MNNTVDISVNMNGTDLEKVPVLIVQGSASVSSSNPTSSSAPVITLTRNPELKFASAIPDGYRCVMMRSMSMENVSSSNWIAEFDPKAQCARFRQKTGGSPIYPTAYTPGSNNRKFYYATAKAELVLLRNEIAEKEG